jgi:hypothetical protein
MPRRFCLFQIVTVLVAIEAASAVEPGGFQVETMVVLQELSPSFCWFHPRAAAIPGHGQDGLPAVIMTIQKHLVADDHYSGLWMLRTDDLGKTWRGPTEIPELAWRKEPGNPAVDLAVADVTPGWHAPTKKLIAIGTQVRYNAAGAQLLDRPRSYDFAYSVFDPSTGQWTVWRNLAGLPADPEGTFHRLSPGCVQWLTQPDGTLLVPVAIQGPAATDDQATVLHLDFDGQTLTYRGHGDILTIEGGRGFSEPSLARCGGKYYLTLRNDHGAFVTAGADGLSFAPPRPWTFDDGKDLGSYNTQAHWLTHGDDLYLCYTRRGAGNDHIPRHRAPLFMAQVDPERLQVIRATEQVLIPERGVMLGNFGASSITPDESWVTDSEFLVSDQPHPRGANGSTWVARIRWTRSSASALQKADSR